MRTGVSHSCFSGNQHISKSTSHTNEANKHKLYKYFQTELTNTCAWSFIHHCSLWLYLMLLFSRMAAVGFIQGLDFINFDETSEITAEPWSQLSRQLLGNFRLWLHFLVNFTWTFSLDLMIEKMWTDECSSVKSLLIEGDNHKNRGGLWLAKGIFPQSR